MSPLSGIRVIVFDFDGTLIQSNKLKYDAYFRLFPKDSNTQAVIENILSSSFEKSRYEIIQEIVAHLDGNLGDDDRLEILAGGYNDIVLEGAKMCPEVSKAFSVLKKLHQSHSLYLSSTTPEEFLNEIVSFRKWDSFFQEIYGYPRDKTQTLKGIMSSEGVNAQQLLVVGDGESDYVSAENTGCCFFRKTVENSLEELLG